MDNAYYILAKKQISIERFHICTWEFPNESSYVEFGLEFPKNAFSDDKGSLEFYLAVPFIKRDDTIKCLMKNLSDVDNSRFIFNDVVKGIETVGEDSRSGSILKFESRDVLTILPCDMITNDGLITIKIKKPQKSEGNLYIRILVKLSDNTIAIKKSGIAQSTYIYDFKINETRNLPQNIYEVKNSNGLQICKIQNLFCLHAVPDSFEFSFVDTKKLKNIRKLESSAFQDYLPEVEGISKDCFNIMFLKDKDCESYSFFTVCTEETIGAKQISLAVAANIICSLLFAVSSLRFVKDPSIAWYSQIPWEFWGAFVILILLCIYLFTPLKKKI